MLYGITQCYLQRGIGDFTAFTPSDAGTPFIDTGGMQGCVDLFPKLRGKTLKTTQKQSTAFCSASIEGVVCKYHRELLNVHLFPFFFSLLDLLL